MVRAAQALGMLSRNGGEPRGGQAATASGRNAGLLPWPWPHKAQGCTSLCTALWHLGPGDSAGRKWWFLLTAPQSAALSSLVAGKGPQLVPGSRHEGQGDCSYQPSP